MKLDLTCPIASAPKEQKTEKDEKKGNQLYFFFLEELSSGAFFFIFALPKKTSWGAYLEMVTS